MPTLALGLQGIGPQTSGLRPQVASISSSSGNPHLLHQLLPLRLRSRFLRSLEPPSPRRMSRVESPVMMADTRRPQLDGNVHRLLSRVLALHAPPKSKQTLDVLWAGASAFVQDADRPGDVNQALIELGSTVCKVREPSCGACPLQRWCAAYERQEAQGKEGKEDGEVCRAYMSFCWEVCCADSPQCVCVSRARNIRRRAPGIKDRRHRTSRSSARFVSRSRWGLALWRTP